MSISNPNARPSSPTYDLLRSMPKVELHLHLEGSIQPATLLELARRHNKPNVLPADDVPGLRSWFQFTSFSHFIEIYVVISDLLREPDDFALIVTDLGDELARQAVRYAEVTFTPFTHTHLLKKGLGISDLLAGLDEGRQRVLARHSIQIVWIFDIPRNVSFAADGRYDPKPADITLAYAIEGRHHGVIGFGLGGNEVGAPAAPFAHAFAAAKAAGLRSLPHAGETVGPESVWGALHALGAERIGHGVRAIEDADLLAYLHHTQIPLEANLTSNICLHVYKSLAHHPLPHLDRMGLNVTVNSDDPPLFNTDLTNEYAALMDIFKYSLDDVGRIAHNAIRASFAPPNLRQAISAELDEWLAIQNAFTRRAP